MELLNPTLTIQNTTSTGWLVRIRHNWTDHEYLDFAVAITRHPSMEIAEAFQAAIAQMTHRAKTLHILTGTPVDD
jgi:hypothetical protein